MTNWGPAAVIVLGYVMGFYFQNKRIDDRFNDFREAMNKRFDDLYHYLDVRFGEIERRLSALEGKVEVKQ